MMQKMGEIELSGKYNVPVVVEKVLETFSDFQKTIWNYLDGKAHSLTLQYPDFVKYRNDDKKCFWEFVPAFSSRSNGSTYLCQKASFRGDTLIVVPTPGIKGLSYTSEYANPENVVIISKLKTIALNKYKNILIDEILYTEDYKELANILQDYQGRIVLFHLFHNHFKIDININGFEKNL